MTTSADRPSASIALRLLFAGALAGSPGSATGAEEIPDAEFLEYLGSWEGADDEWLLVLDEAAQGTGRTDETDDDPVPEDEESAEKVDD